MTAPGEAAPLALDSLYRVPGCAGQDLLFLLALNTYSPSSHRVQQRNGGANTTLWAGVVCADLGAAVPSLCFHEELCLLLYPPGEGDPNQPDRVVF